MTRLKYLLVAIGLLFFVPTAANAATCFWVGGGPFIWDGTNTGGGGTGGIKWASTSGGATACAATSGPAAGVPGPSDSATFDGSSGTGTVTFNQTGTGKTIGTLTMSAYAGTLDNSTNNIALTLSGSLISAGSAVRTLNCGTATWIFTSSTTPVNFAGATSFTDTCTAATFSFRPASLTATPTISLFTNETGFPKIDLQPPSGAVAFPFYIALTTAGTIAGLTTTNSPAIVVTNATTLSITAAPALSASLANPILFYDSAGNNTGGQVTITTPAGFTCNYCAFANINLTNAPTVPFTNSWNLARNTNVNVTAPAGGGIIGGGL